MKRNSSNISGRQSSMTKQPRFSQPGTLTRTEILGAPSRPLRWLLPSTPRTLRPLLQPSSSSPRNPRLNWPSRQADLPSVESVGYVDTPISDAPRPTRRAPFVRFTILAWLIDVRIQPAPGAGTISQSYPVVQHRPPHCCNWGNDHTAIFKECPAPPRSTVPSRPSIPEPQGQDPIDVALDGDQALSTPPSGAGPSQMDLVTPRQPPPAGPPRPGSTQVFGGSLPLEEPSPSPAPSARRVRPGNE